MNDATPLQRALILVTLTMTIALYAMTVTIANVALPQIQGALSATQDQIAMVVTLNIVATAVVTPMAGWLTARFGQRRVILFSIGLFTLATMACGMAPSLETLVLARIAQGGFGAPLAPVSQSIVLSTYPRQMHGKVNAAFGMGVVLGPLIAPTIGGLLSEEYGWRWVFYMIVPLAMVSFVACWLFIMDGGRQLKVRLEWIGFILLSLTIASIQLTLDRGERQSWFESPEIVIEAAIALIGLYLVIVHTTTADRTFVNKSLFRDRNFVIGMILMLVFGMLNFTPMTLLPALMKNLQGYPDSVIGFLLALRGSGTMLGFTLMLLVGGKFQPRTWAICGFALQAASGLLLTQFTIDVPFATIATALAMQGLGTGLLWVPLTLITFATLDLKLFTEGSSFFHLIRNLGSSMHISASIAVVLHTSKVSYGHLVENISPYDKMLQLPWVTGAWSYGSARSLAAIGGEVQRQGLMIGYINAFYFYSFTAMLALPLLLLVRRQPRP
jgi:DHA2 family multidrug resistance protein